MGTILHLRQKLSHSKLMFSLCQAAGATRCERHLEALAGTPWSPTPEPVGGLGPAWLREGAGAPGQVGAWSLNMPSGSRRAAPRVPYRFPLNLASYRTCFKTPAVVPSLENTFFFCVLFCTLCLRISPPHAYFIAKFHILAIVVP